MKATGQEGSSVSCEAVVPGKIHRLVPPLDDCLKPMSDTEIEKYLTDPFGKTLLRQGIFPANTQDLIKVLGSTFGYSPTGFVVGEGSQIPTSVSPKEDKRLRFEVNFGANETDAKIFLSKPGATTSADPLEIISYDPQTKGYNYYVLSPQLGAADDSPFVWAWVGHSSFARKPETMNQGCFSCHHNGIPIMRELELPWNNWQSQRANISSATVPAAVASDTVFQQRRGAELFEQIIRGNIQTFYNNWLRERTRKSGGITNISDVGELLRHVITNTTVNLKSTDIQSNGQNTTPKNIDISGVPPNDTFLADTLFQTTLGLNYSSLSVTLPRNDYDAYLNAYDFKLVGTKGFFFTSEKAFEYPGSTYFAFFVPQVAAEDIYVTNKLLQSKIVTDKFVAALLMVDYQNPLFSSKRASLQKYADQITTGTITKGVSSVPEDFVAKIKQTGATASTAGSFDDSSAESQFLYTWELPDDQWKQVTAQRLQGYVDSIANKEPGERLDYLLRWSIKQRDRFISTSPFCNFRESRLLFPETSLSPVPNCPKSAANAE
ncbi:hypothetical protein [Aetokthonos hydrillicola]|nr:hypothetical protein [Aetokthonos hydrillicola]MBO3463165.1 hypothetical protein [Aetokthonos hydrillicola CCALA 1050]